jgi:uncharacterized membrane protein
MDIAVFHPQFAHFVIALGVIGVIFRMASLIGRLRFLSSAATILLVLTAGLAALSVASGDQAHEFIEDIPGVREPMTEHEEWGERTRNLFIGIAAIELIGLAFMSEKRRRIQRGFHMASALAGLIGLAFIYETGEHGGALVYSYGAGPGIRSKKPEDVENALVAGLYNAAMQNREAGKKEDAARLIAEIERLRPNDPTVKLVTIESIMKDKNDPNGALAALRGFAPGDDPRLRMQVGVMKVDAFIAAQQPDSARATITQLVQEFPESAFLKRRAQELQVK